MRLRWDHLLLVSVLGLSACGGIKRDARVATAIQTIMANAMTSFASNDGSTTITYKCGKTDAEGTLSYSAAGLTDPLKLIEYIQNNGDQNIALPLTFTNCKIKACTGESLVLNGATAELVLDIKPDALIQTGGNLSPDQIPARFQVNLTNIAATGFLSGTISFSYIIEADYDKSSLNGVEIYDSTIPNPLVDSGKSFPATELNELSEGC